MVSSKPIVSAGLKFVVNPVKKVVNPESRFCVAKVVALNKSGKLIELSLLKRIF